MRASLILPFIGLASVASAYTEVTSKYIMFKNIDPIVFPGSYNKSHQHIFFGSDAVEATTTTSAELREGCTTAENPNDLSTYWTPTLLYTGQASPSPIVPYRFSAYYENIQDAEIAFPDNMKLVTGKATATTAAETDPSTDAQWFCEGSEPAADKVSFPTSTCATHLQHLLYFPDCVNPTTLAYTFSGTQNWNATFKPANRCPSDMKRIPRLRFSIRYDLRKIISKGWSGAPPLELSSGNSFSSHGDFFNGWNPTAATNMLAATGTSFLGISGPLGGPYDGGKCTAKDADPTHGTSDYETSVKLQSKRSVMIEREFVA